MDAARAPPEILAAAGARSATLARTAGEAAARECLWVTNPEETEGEKATAMVGRARKRMTRRMMRGVARGMPQTRCLFMESDL
jgi:hypothetical protein